MTKLNTINIHFLDACNYTCKHCFVNKENNKLSFKEVCIAVDKIAEYFKEENITDGRINLAGGEPLLSKDIDRIIDYIYSCNIKVSLITNAYYITKEFVDRHKNQLCCIGISVDSLNDETNRIIGRCQRDGKLLDTNKLIDICKYIRLSGIKLKINTCVSKLNYKEDFTYFLESVKPDRYKVLQMLCSDYDLINVRNRISNLEMNEFVQKHRSYITVVESSKEMEKSYLIIDSKGNLTTNNSHDITYSIFDYKISDILYKLKINELDFAKRYSNTNKLSTI